jgi:RimJ/RimL family protein N-acetyltransferase
MPRHGNTFDLRTSPASVINEGRRIVHRLWQLVVVWRESLVFFTYDPRQGDGAIDDQIRVFRGHEDVPADVRAEFLRSRSFTLWVAMWLRMRFQGAILLVRMAEGKLSGYLWLRECDPFLRRYRWLTPRGLLIGYVWVAPAFRGHEVSSALNKAGIALSRDRRNMPLIVYTDVSNTASIRALEKVGFARLGTYDVTSGALGFYCRHKTIGLHQTIRDVWSAEQE